MRSPGEKVPWQATLLAASILSLCFPLGQGQTGNISITVEPEMPRKGASVTLKPGTLPENSVTCRWYRGSAADPNLIIIRYPKVPGDTKGPAYTGRETVDSNCSLQITDLNTTDSGIYTMTTDGPGFAVSGSGKFEVIENLYTPSVSVSPSPFPRELIDPVQLTCNTVTSELATVSWLWNGEPLGSSFHIQLSENNRTLTIQPVFRNDAGEYQCEVLYLSSSETSDKIFIPVIFGPDEPVIEPNSSIYYERSDIRLTCKASTFPDPTYTWFLNGRHYSNGADLLIPDVTSKQSGSYTCQATHVLTLKMANATQEIQVLDSVYNVSITGPSYVLENQAVTLTCHSPGTDVSYSWLKGSQLIEAGGNVFLENNKLTLNTTSRDDAANYTCYANNSFSFNLSEPYRLEIFYGPDEPSIEPNRNVYQEFETLILSCSANSNPPANYSWYRNGELLEHGSTSQLQISSLSPTDGGNYTCNATNEYTGLFNATNQEIRILRSVYNVTITGPSFAVENQAVTLTCLSPGTDVSYSWFKGNQLLEAGGNVFLENNKLTLNTTSRDDAANYTCYANNSFSFNFSEPYRLEVFYGPDEPSIEPTRSVYQEFETLILSCSANSNPPANYSWYHNGELLEHENTSQLQISSLSLSDHGNYTCNATNEYTGLFNATNQEIRIWRSVYNVTITGPSFVVENQAVTLTCLSSGTDVSYSWFKGNQLLEAGGNVFLENNKLTLNTTSRDDAANYTCYANNSFSFNFSEPYRLEVFYGPDEPSIEPPRSVYQEFETLILSCSANSNPPANYSWYRNGELLEHENTSQLQISSLSLSDHGNYTCNATNEYTGLFNATNQEIRIWRSVYNVTITGPSFAVENQAVTLTCLSPGTDVSYSWFKGNQRLEAGGNVFLENNKLTLNTTSRDDAANYTCYANNSFSFNFSEPYRLEVFYGPDEPSIEPPRSVYQEFETLILSCSANSNPPANYSWYRNGELLEHENTSQLQISSLSLSDHGNYTCNATNEYTGLFNATNQEIRIWRSVYNVTITGPSFAVENQAVTLTCLSPGTDVSYSWFKGNQRLEAGGNVFLENNKLTLNTTSRDDAANYTCYANNSFSFNFSEPYRLEVFYGPDEPSIEPTRSVYQEFETLVLSCSANSNPPANYSWYRNGELLEHENTSQLQISSLSPTDGGNYTCHATNEYTGLFNATNQEIRILRSVYNVTITGPSFAVENQAVTLTCLSPGTDVSYSWFKGNQLLEAGGNVFLENNKLTLNTTSRDDAANYICYANNSFSFNFSEPYRLEVFYGPDEPSIEPSRSVYQEFETLILSCSANSNPPANYSWYRNGELLEHENTSQLQISSLSLSDHGNYTCNATNEYTGLFNATNQEIRIWRSVYNVTITGPSFVVENQAVTLTCLSPGTDVSFFWFKGNQLLEAGGNVFLENNKLTLNTTSRDDAANYTCYANNSVSFDFSGPYWLDVFYGPDEPIIKPNGSVYHEFETLNLSCSANSNPPASYSWYHNGQPLEHRNTSRLVISALSLSNNGSYTCNATNEYTGLFNYTDLEISILESVTHVTITGEPIKVFENNKTVLTCTAAGSNVSYFWLKGSQSLVAGGHISVSNNSQILTFNPVSRNDSDIYTCYGNNTFSSNSTSYVLSAFYGPDEVVISPDNHYYEKGSNLNLTCTADSNPPAYYIWSYGPSVHIGSTLPLFNLSLDHSANYICEAFNNETHSSLIKVVELEVEEKLSKPILSPAKYAALENENITLYCDISSSSAFNISWFRRGLAMPTKAIISEDKNLTLPDFTKDDAGTYTCVASNHLGMEESNPSEITLAYGPISVKVEPAGVINQKLGSKLDLLCTADSNPEAQFQWFFNGTDQRVTNNTFSVDAVAWTDEGNYTCQASNTVTKSHALAFVIVKVTNQDAPSDGGGLSGGAIAGIVIGCLAGVILVAGLLYFLCTKTSLGRTEHHISNGNIPSAPGHNQGVTDTKPRSGEEDVQYSTLAFNANTPPQPTPGATQPSDGTIIYSEIKKK